MHRDAVSDTPRIEGYEFVRVIGGGSFADVLLYSQKYTNRLVAVKVLRSPITNIDEGQAFDAEVASLAELSSHPCIVTLHSAGRTDDGRPYLVMEHCALQSLEDVRHGGLSLGQMLSMTVMLCGAVETAHRRGIVHGDIKPQNVLVTEYSTPKLADFGIATLAGDRRTVQAYSVPWAAPELLQGSQATPSTDTYALAATLYTLLAGHAPYVDPEVSAPIEEIARRAQTQPLAPLDRRRIPEPVAVAVERGLARNGHDRPRSAAELGVALQEAERSLGLPVTSMHIPDSDAAASPGLLPEATSRRSDQPELAGSAGFDDTAFRTRGSLQGSLVGPAAYQPPPVPPMVQQATRSGSGRRGRIIGMVVAAVVVALLATTGVAWAVMGGLGSSGTSGQPAAAAATSEPTPTHKSAKPTHKPKQSPSSAPTATASSGGATALSSPEPSSTDASTPTETSSPSPTQELPYTCWDGTDVSSLSSCPAGPTGETGIRWVFPSLADARTDPNQPCHEIRPHDCRQVTAFNCAYTAPNGDPIQIGYYEWDNPSSAEDALQVPFINVFPARDRPVQGQSGVQTLWRGQFADGSYRAAGAYNDEPFSFWVQSWSTESVNYGLTLVKSRAPSDFAGVAN